MSAHGNWKSEDKTKRKIKYMETDKKRKKEEKQNYKKIYLIYKFICVCIFIKNVHFL